MTVRWGVVGTGGIARRFAEAMAVVDGGSIVAVASRTAEAADAYAERFEVARRHVGIEALAADGGVDVVYVATPNHRHRPDTLLLLEAGHPVLCEKPLALDAREAAAMVGAARDRGLFLMEAVWSRFLPAYRSLGEVLKEGTIGEVRMVEASFGFAAPVMPGHRLFDPAQGGGSLLDVGIYPLQLCSLVLGPPDRVTAGAHVGETGVDEQLAAVLHHPGGALGIVSSAITTNLRNDARIVGERGVIEFPPFMHCPDHLLVHGPTGTTRIEAAWEGDGLRFQIEEVHRCLAEGVGESTVMPLDESLRLSATMDGIRRLVGVRFPSVVEPSA